MNPRYSILCLVLLITSTNVYGQIGYLRKGTLYIQGDISDQGIFKNNRQLLFIENGKPVPYTPDEVEEYGFIGGDAYIKRTVQGGQISTNYFLLRLVNGDRILYELKEKKGSRFFLEHNNALVEIRKEGPLVDQLNKQLKVCNSNQPLAALTHYGKTSLKRAVLLSNQCYAGFFPRLRLGMLAGYEFSSQALESIIHHIAVQASASSPLVGVFVDLPLGTSPSWAMNFQASYQQSNFSDYHIDNNFTVEYQYNFTTIGFPVLLKYRGTFSTWRPFIAMGLTPAIYAQQQNAWLTTTYKGSNAYLSQGTWDTLKKFQISGTLIAGLEYSLNPKKAVSLEMRFKKLIDAQVGPSHSFALIGSYYF